MKTLPKKIRIQKKAISLNLIVFCLFILALHSSAQGQPVNPQNDSSAEINYRARKQTLFIGGTAAYAGVLGGLSYMWYANTPQSRFHFFNDNGQWLQLDKTGHFYTAYHFGRITVPAFEWAGYSERKAQLLGSITGFVLQTPIEILDGLSAQYGASTGDLLANAAGSGLLLGQYLLWGEERITPSFSFYPTSYPALRPNVLGKSIAHQILKDYNGQTYWLDFKVGKFHQKLPGWLELSLGYGGEEMVYGDPTENQQAGFRSYRQYYISGSINFDAIHTKSKFVKTVFYILDTIKIPFPALSYDTRQGITIHPLFF